MSALGNSRSRVDGTVKTTGAARYAADWPTEGLLHAVLVTATIPAGRLVGLDTAVAEGAAGVVAVFTHRNTPRLAATPRPPSGQRVLPLQDDTVRYEGEPIALVVAERLEQAQEAAALVHAEYASEPAVTDFDDAVGSAYRPPDSFEPADSTVGDVRAGLARADVLVERHYSTAARHHSPMEPSATLAEWRDGELTLHDATQWVYGVRAMVSSALGLPAERVRVVSSFTGGGFGCKGFVWPHQLLAAMAAREVGGAVRLVLTRAQTFAAHGYQPPTRQTVTLGAAADGTLTALRHTSVNATSTYDAYIEMAAVGSRAMYASPSIETRHRVAPVALITPTPMRAPHEGPGMFALESAMDELAYELGVDPLDLRLRNYAEHDPTSGRPFSSKELRECYRLGAERFGWARRPMAPRSLRDGHHLVGWGMASAIMSTFRMPAAARARIHADGRAVIETGCQEIGTGPYTVMPQIAAETLGCSPDQVTLRLGDTTLPEAGLTAGSSTTLSVGSAVQEAATALRARLASMALGEGGATGESTSVIGDELVVDGRPATRVRLGELFGRSGVDSVSAEASWAPGNGDDRSMYSFGAVFAEVRVDEDLCLPRVSRIVGVYSAGRIINPLTARSQMIGGMTWGIGQALLEQSVTDAGLGRFVSKNLAGYLVPVNADVPVLEADFVEERDEYASAIGARGIGEVGAVGVSAAIANAVYHATGIRVRDLPITPEALLGATR